jgi:hypothetical protein
MSSVSSIGNSAAKNKLRSRAAPRPPSRPVAPNGRPRPLLAVFAVICSEISVMASPRSVTRPAIGTSPELNDTRTLWQFLRCSYSITNPPREIWGRTDTVPALGIATDDAAAGRPDRRAPWAERSLALDPCRFIRQSDQTGRRELARSVFNRIAPVFGGGFDLHLVSRAAK